MAFGHTQGKPHEPRYDYGHGATDLYSNCFYLEQGGYSLYANDSANIVPLATDNTPVDTINLQALWQRMETAIRKEYTKEMDIRIAEASEQADKLTAMKNLAKEYIDKANQFDYYKQEDLTELINLYNNGKTTDAAGLAQWLHYTAYASTPLKRGKVAKVEHLGVAHGYQIMTKGDSALKVSGNNIAFASDNIATDNSYNWRFIRQGNSNKFLVYNIGKQLYLDPSAKGMVSDKPTVLTLNADENDQTFTISLGTSLSISNKT